MKIIRSFLFLLIAALVLWCAVDVVRYKRPNKIDRWTIVCRETGEYSFISFTDRPHYPTFATREEAEAQMAITKRWSDDFDARMLQVWHPCTNPTNQTGE